MTELEAAEAVRDGNLSSPTKFGSMFLWALRITGTGASYRSAHEEYVWRSPELYLNEEFCRRCNGLPVIWEHPTTVPSLDSNEFAKRIIGTVMLPYIKGEDVYGICRIYDDEANRLMSEGQLSTSPSVVFKPTDGNEKIQLEDGEVLLIEGKPSYLDHLAVCTLGVWDREGPPLGVQNDLLTEGDGNMAEEDKKADAGSRHDATMEKMDAFMDSFNAKISDMSARLDAWEKEKTDASRKDAARKDKFGRRKDGESYADWSKRHDDDEEAMMDAMRKDGADEKDCMDAVKDARKDAEEEEKRSDKEFEKWAKEEEEEPAHKEDSKKDAKKDADEEEEKKEEKEEEKADSRKDSAVMRENDELKARLAKLERVIKGITIETPAAERDALAAAQNRADSVAAQFGDRVSAPIPGETALEYRRRLLKRFAPLSPRFKDSRFDSLDPAMLQPIEDQVYADAVANARAPSDTSNIGVLIPYEERDAAGRLITRYHGDPMAWMAPFMSGATIGRINSNPKGRN